MVMVVSYDHSNDGGDEQNRSCMVVYTESHLCIYNDVYGAYVFSNVSRFVVPKG